VCDNARWRDKVSYEAPGGSAHVRHYMLANNGRNALTPRPLEMLGAMAGNHGPGVAWCTENDHSRYMALRPGGLPLQTCSFRHWAI
jgi:hypothetical protein